MNAMNRVSDAFNNSIDPALLGKDAVAGASSSGFRSITTKLGRNSLLVFATQPSGLAAEQYRQLRRNLAEHFPEGGTLLVTSPAQAEGKTMNAMNLAWCLAETGQPTLLVEGDLRRPTVAEVLGCTIAQGIEAALRGEVDPKAAVSAVDQLSLHVAAVAKPPKDPGNVIKGAGTQKFMDWARGQFRWIVVDAPPVLPAADAMELCPLADAVLLVVRARVTPRELLEKSYQLLGNRLRGIIFNEASLCWDSYHRYLTDYYGQKTK